jgi:hypothetical protein
MAIKTGLVTNEEAFGKEADLEKNIVKVGWTETPFLSTISSAAPTSRSAKAAGGHRWFYDEEPDGEGLTNAHIEGSAPAASKYYVGAELLNHYQIIKNSYGISGSEEESVMVNGKLVLTDQFEKATVVQKKTLEQVLLSAQAPVQRVNTVGSEVAGKSGGLKYFATANNTITETSTTLSWKLLRELLKIGFMQGGAYTHIMMNDIQKDALDDIVFSKAQTTLNASRLENNITMIGSTAYGNNVKIILNPYLADDEIIAYRPKDIYKVNWRPMHTKELGRNKDAVEKEIISEFTLRVCHPYAFAWLKGLATS